MYRLSDFQIYCLMVILLTPIAFLEQPKRLALLIQHNAWLACIAVIIPGLLIVNMFPYIIKKSQNPFPYLLEEYFGKIGGKILGFIYIGVFIFIASYTLTLFVNFVITNVLPQTPITVLIASLLSIGYFIIKSGFQNFSRSVELVILLGLPVVVTILLLTYTQNIDLGNFLPIGYMNYKNFALAVVSITSILGRVFPILTIGYLCEDISKLNRILTLALFTYVGVLLLPTTGVTLAFGGIASTMLVFPALSLIRQIDIAQFITNIDIFFIGLWISGTVSAFCIFWYMACFTTQQIFSFKKYSFLAAPSSLIIAIMSLMLSPNIIILEIINTVLVIGVYLIFFLFIPFLIFIMSLFKPDKNLNNASEKQNPPALM